MPPRELARLVPGVAGANFHGPGFEDGAEIVGERVDRRIALRRFLAQSFSHHRIQVARQGGIQASERDRLHSANCFFDRIAAGRRMGRLPGDQFIQHRAQGIDVSRGGLGGSLYLFGARIFRRQHPLFRHALLAGFVQNLGDTEVQNLRSSTGFDENIPWFKIAMDHQIAMQISDRVAD